MNTPDDKATREQQTFAVGDVVQRVNQPEAVGVIRDARWDEQSEDWNYSVQFGAQLKVVPGGSLRPVVKILSPWDGMRDGTFSGQEHLVLTLTFQRLRRPPTRIAYSFATSRTQFYPHQFRPLLKFLDHPGKRLLIADDVGLGKTIEAGYILRELEARQVVERVLILVPARLAPKWKRELSSRFDESFDIAKGSDLLMLANRIRQGREPDPFRWIISYESARPEEIRKALDETQPAIDILIADEAHRMRNPESLQHKVGATICRFSDAVIFLSATPIQNGREDLWHLLRLLSPEEFSDFVLFESQLESNRPLLCAQRALTGTPPAVDSAVDHLESFFHAAAGRHLRNSELARSIRERLASGPNSRRDIVELQADVARLSPTGHILSRTRKAEAVPNRAVRTAFWKRVPLSAAERQIYDSVEHLCRMSWSGASESWGFQMGLLMAYRMTASCIPAAMQCFAERLGTTTAALPLATELEEDEMREDAASSESVSGWTGPPRDTLAEAVRHYGQVAGVDTKLEYLTEFLSSIWEEDVSGCRSRRKVVIFSYFRRTLEYLARSLAERGMPNRMIHGGVAVPDREAAIDDFLERNDIPLLLTSDVGGEGIDLQRASVLVNYDLPWNPMVVEQRIGRIDRIGQQATRLLISNLIVTDSVEERVLKRLLDKIGLFRDSIGELDPILGEDIEKLTTQALRGELAPEDVERVVAERGDAIERRIVEARQMLSRVDGLLAADQGLIDEINAVTGERQIPPEKDLLLFLNKFLAERVPGCQIPREAVGTVVAVDFRGALPARMEQDAIHLPIGAELGFLARRMLSGPIPVTLSREAAYHHSRAELLHLRHPLVRYAVAQTERESSTASPTAFCIRLAKSAYLPPNIYAFLVSLVEIRGHRPTIYMAAAICEVNGSQTWTDPDQTTPIVLEMLEHGTDMEPARIPPQNIDKLQQRLVSAVSQLITDWNRREQRLDQARSEQQRAAVRAILELRIQREQERLEALRSQRAPDFPIRMAQHRLERRNRELTELGHTEAASSWSSLEQEEIAIGLLRVG